MSLDWNLTEIENHKELCFVTAEEDDKFHGITKGDRLLSPVTNAIIWLTCACRAGWGINEENVEELIARADLWQKLNGAMLNEPDEETGGWKPRVVSADDIRNHVGMWTNAGFQDRVEWLTGQFAYAYPNAPMLPNNEEHDDYDDFALTGN